MNEIDITARQRFEDFAAHLIQILQTRIRAMKIAPNGALTSLRISPVRFRKPTPDGLSRRLPIAGAHAASARFCVPSTSATIHQQRTSRKQETI